MRSSSAAYAVCAVLALICYAASLLGHLPHHAGPAFLRQHANFFQTVGGVFLVIVVWSNWRGRRNQAHQQNVAR